MAEPQGHTVPRGDPGGDPGGDPAGDPISCEAATDLAASWSGCEPFLVQLSWSGGPGQIEVASLQGELLASEEAESPFDLTVDRAATLAWTVSTAGCAPRVGPWVRLDEGRRWRELDEVPPARAGHALVADDDGALIIVGGYDWAGDRTDVWSTRDGSWQQLTTDAELGARRWFGAAELDGWLWVVAGNRGGGSTNLGDAWRSMDGTTWTLANATAVPPRHAPVLMAFDGALWVVAGEGPNCQSRADVYRSPDGLTWELVSADAGFGARDWHAGAVLHGRMWIVGGVYRGLGCESDYLDDVWSSVDGVTWTLEAAGEFPARAGHALVSDGARLWLVGGTTAWPVATHSDVWYSDDGRNWCQATEEHAFSNRFDHGAAARDDGLWVVGGFSGELAADGWRSP